MNFADLSVISERQGVEMNVLLSKIKINDWRQFENLEIELDPSITIITGTNGSGKSTILSIINKHYGFERPFMGSPEKALSTSSIRYNQHRGFSGFVRKTEASSEDIVGSIQYSSGYSAHLVEPKQTGPVFELQIVGQANIRGTHIDSHSRPALYQGLPSQNYSAPSLKDISGITKGMATTGYRGDGYETPLAHFKLNLIQMALFGYGNAVFPGRVDLKTAYEEFEDVLRKFLPEELGFEKFIIEPPELVLRTKSGDFFLEACSGGVLKSLLVAWQLFMETRGPEKILVTIDEPENHLHPSMQKNLINKLTALFPKCQFVVATHSPFVVSSMEESKVYALRVLRSENGDTLSRVRAHELTKFDRAGTASEIMTEVLGVDSTIPDWVGAKIERIVRKYRGWEMSANTLNSLMADLSEVGLSTHYPEAAESLLK